MRFFPAFNAYSGKGRMRKPRKGNKANGAPIPVYYKLQMELLKGIEEGNFAPGEAIPPERKIATDFGVSLGTVNRAIMNLVSEGYLNRIQGKGTFVSGTSISQASVRYTRMRTEFKSADPVFKIKILDLKTMEGRQPICKYLRIRIRQPLYRLRRVFIENRKPIVYNISYLPRKMFGNFGELQTVHLEKTTLYEALEKKYGLPTIFNQELFGVSLADEDTSEVLQIDVGHPVLKIEMLSFTYKDRPYEYRIAYCNVDKKKMFREM